MKKLIVLFFALLCLNGVVFAAKNVNVLFNFPQGSGETDVSELISLDNDANAFTAFMQTAENNGILMNLTYYEGMGWFVNGINGINNTATEYWLFWSNFIAMPPAGIGDFIPADGEIIELAFTEWPSDTELSVLVSGLPDNSGVELYLNNSVLLGSTNASGEFNETFTLKKDTYSLKAVKETKQLTKNFTATDYSLISIEFDFNQENEIDLAVQWLLDNQKPNGEFGEHAVWGNAFALMGLSLTEGHETEKSLGFDYLLSNQGNDAGFGYPGFGSDALHSAVATMAFLSNGYSLNDFDKNEATTIDYILNFQQSDGGFSSFGGSDIDTTSWVITALTQSSTELPSNNGNTPINYLYGVQNSDGGFGYLQGEPSSIEWTAEALIALAAANESKNSNIQNALNFLNSQKKPIGCFSNAFTTELSALALMAFEEDSNQTIDCLKTLQLSDGGFGRNDTESNAVDTALALIVLSEKTLPLTIEENDSNAVIPIDSLIKFSVKIQNTGSIDATNVEIELNGVNENWIKEESTTSFPRIRAGEAKTAIIYVEFSETGNYEISASVSSRESRTANSNALQIEIQQALLDAVLSYEVIE